MQRKTKLHSGALGASLSIRPRLRSSGSGSGSGPPAPPGSLHVDGVRVLLAQGFVLLGVERLPLQIHVADLGQKTDRVTQAACRPEGSTRQRFVTPLGKALSRQSGEAAAVSPTSKP